MKHHFVIDIPEQLLKDFLTTCVEGGSAYWLAAERVIRDDELNVLSIVGPCDAEDRSTKWPTITLDTMVRGIELILNGQCDLAGSIRGDVLAAVHDDDTVNWDAETADCVLQAGMFGEIVYG